MAAGYVLDYASTANSTFNGSIGGEGGLEVDSGTLIVGGANTYSGGTLLTSQNPNSTSTLELGSWQATLGALTGGADAGAVVVLAGGILDLNGYAATVTSLSSPTAFGAGGSITSSSPPSSSSTTTAPPWTTSAGPLRVPSAC